MSVCGIRLARGESIVRCYTPVLLTGLLVTHLALAEPPVPMGTSTTTVSYQTAAGPVSFSDDRNYNGLTPSDATILGGAPNIKSFNSANHFGRRTELAGSNPAYAHIIGPDETLLAHTFFKINNGNDYFPGIVAGSDLTVTVNNIRFAGPVTVVPSTFLFHTLWIDTQVDQLDHPYHHLHNLHTASPFRDSADFFDGGLFSDFPEPNYTLANVSPMFTGNGTDTLGFSITIPYDPLRNLADEGHGHPPHGLPAPHGFLEPFHFHVEYVVTPEPATFFLLAPVLLLFRRRNR